MSKKAELDKKYKKQKQILLDPKADLPTKHKTILYFIENNQKEIFIEILRENKTIIGGLLNIYHTINDTTQKKQKTTLTEKDGEVIQTLLQFAVQNCTSGEITYITQLTTVFKIFLACETPFSIRKHIFSCFIDIIVKLNAAKDDNLKIFINSLGYIAFVKDNNMNLTALHIPSGVPVPTSTENDVLSTKQQTFALLDIFFEKFAENPEILYPFFKELLAYTCSDYAKEIFLDSYKQRTGFDAKNVPNDLLDCILKSICNEKVLKGLIPLHDKLMKLMMYFYDIVIGMDVIHHNIITRTIQNYFTNFILNDTLSLKINDITDEQIQIFKSTLIQKVANVMMKNKGNEEAEVQILIQNIIKVIMSCLKKVNDENLQREIVLMIQKGVLGFLPNEIGIQTQLLITPVMECLLIVWMYWNKHNIEEWKTLKSELKVYFKETLIVEEIQRKINQLTLIIVNKFYKNEKKTEVSLTDIPLHLQTLKVENIQLILHEKEEIMKELIHEDVLLNEYVQQFSHIELLNLWNILFDMLEDVAELPVKSQTHCCKCLLILLEFLIAAEKHSTTIEEITGNGRIQLYDVFFPYLTKVIKQNKIAPEDKYLVYNSLCHLMIRETPRITNEIYSHFYSLIQELNEENKDNTIMEQLLIESYQIFTMQLPGVEILIPTYLNFFETYTKTQEDANVEMKVNTLLQTIINILVTSEEFVQQLSFEKSVYSILSDILLKRMKEMKTQSGIISFIWMVEGFIQHIITINKLEEIAIEELIKEEMQFFTAEQSSFVIENILNSFISLHFTIPENNTLSLVKQLLEIIIKKEVTSQTIGYIFFSLIDYFVGEKSLFGYEMTKEIVQLLIDALGIALSMKETDSTKMNANDGADMFLENVLHHYGIFGNKGIDRIDGIEETTNGQWFSLGPTRIISITKPYDIVKNESDETSENKYSINKNEKKMCRVIIRDSIGRWSWDVEPIWVESQLGCETQSIVENVQKLEWKDLMIQTVEKQFKEIIHENSGPMHDMLNSLEEKNTTALQWDFASELFDKTPFEEQITKFEAQMKLFNEKMSSFQQEIIQPTNVETNETRSYEIIPFVSQILETNTLPSIAHSLRPFVMGDKFKSIIKQIDNLPLREIHKFGLIYVKKDQSLLQALKNKEASNEFERLRKTISHSIQSQSFEKSNDKEINYYATHRDEIIFHSLIEANQCEDTMKLNEKQKQIFCSFIQVIFVEDNHYIDVSEIATQFSSVFVIVRPHKYGYHIEIQRKNNIPIVGPLFTGSICTVNQISKLLRETLVNINRMIHNVLMGDTIIRPYIQRTKAIRQFIATNSSSNNNYFNNMQEVMLCSNEIVENE